MSLLSALRDYDEFIFTRYCIAMSGTKPVNMDWLPEISDELKPHMMVMPRY
jgi:hypothetical protein